MKKLIAIAVIGLMSLSAFGQQDTKTPTLPEYILQKDMKIVKDNVTNTLVVTINVKIDLQNKDLEAIKTYIHFFYNPEGYNGWTPQIYHKKNRWTFIFNK